jgi:hypothetical protein
MNKTRLFIIAFIVLALVQFYFGYKTREVVNEHKELIRKYKLDDREKTIEIAAKAYCLGLYDGANKGIKWYKDSEDYSLKAVFNQDSLIFANHLHNAK